MERGPPESTRYCTLFPDTARFRSLTGGYLTEIRQTVVSSVALAAVAEDLKVGDHLLLGKGEELSGGRLKPSILADAMEAIIGAVYLAEGLEGATRLVMSILGTRLAKIGRAHV